MRLALLLVLALGLGPVPAAWAWERPRLYLVVVDGLDARLATPERMPRLFGLLAEEPERTSLFRVARAVMPARTNPNHVSLLTGAYADAHGITGNAYWSRAPDAAPAKLDAAALIEVETLFTVVESTAPALETLAVVAKPKLARLLGAAAGRQHAPDRVWSPERLPAAARDPATGYSTDADTMSAVLALAAEREPDLTLVNLSDVDRTGHGRGPDGPEYAAAVAGADVALGRLVDELRQRGRWARSVLVVTADHGFTALTPAPARPHPVIRFGRALERADVRGVRLVAEGGVEHVYAEGLAATATEVGAAAATLARVAEIAAATPGIVEVLARLPVPGVPRLAEAHPDWHLEHERTGELLLVAAPGHQFVDPWDAVDAALLGNHGGPGELAVPLLVSGGAEALTAAPPAAPAPALVDVAPTATALLGLRAPRHVDGRPLAPAPAGRAMAAVLRAQSPH